MTSHIEALLWESFALTKSTLSSMLGNTASPTLNAWSRQLGGEVLDAHGDVVHGDEAFHEVDEHGAGGVHIAYEDLYASMVRGW